MTKPVPKKATTKKAVAQIKAASSAAILREQESINAHKALEMRRSGKTWWQIAETLKISERYAANLVHKALEEAANLVDHGAKQQLLALEVDRLDNLQQAVWQDAIGGDLKAVETALRIIQTRSKVLGLDNMPTSTVTNNTIVVTGTSEEYVAALRRVSEMPVLEIEEGS